MPLLVLLVICFCSSLSFGQVKDSSIKKEKEDTLKIFSMQEEAFENRNIKAFYKKLDTSLTGAQKHDQLRERKPFTATFPNLGLAYRDLEFNMHYNSDFVSSRRYYEDYFLTNDNAEYFHVNSPYSKAYYVMGPKREQYFNFLFTRNFKENLNFSVNYKIIHANATYDRQKSDDAFVRFTGNYTTKNHKYVVLGDYFYNRMKDQENGGLLHDSAFLGSNHANWLLDSISLYGAENRIKESGFYIRQFYFLGVGGEKAKKDTSKTYVVKPYRGFGRISHSILFKNQSYTYIDANPWSGYYPAPLLDSAVSHDSIHVNSIENMLEWSNTSYLNDSTSQPFLLKISIRHKYSKLYTDSTDTSLVSIIPQAGFRLDIKEKFKVAANGFYYLSGHNKGDLSLSGCIAGNFKTDSATTGSVGITADVVRQSPAWFDQQYSSNSFYWNNSFDPITSKKVRLFCNFKKFDLSLAYYQVKNYIFYDIFAKPKQFAGNVDVLQLKLKKDFIWKHFEMANTILFQKNFHNNVVHLPELLSNHALYYTHDFFKTALTAQLGVEVTFLSSYSPLAWMPSTRVFYIQNDFSTKNYPFMDLFLNLKIKRARIFLKMDHINEGMVGNNDFMIPHYPSLGRAFHFGVSWMFYD